MSENKIQYQSRIHILRAQHNRMTQKELADKVGCTRTTLSKIENNSLNVTLALAQSIAKVFNEPIEHVFIFRNKE